MKVWLITDTHYAHSNIKKYCGRPDGFEDLIVKNIRQTVKEEDVLIHLGDVMMGKQGRPWADQVAALPGRHFLILGNHDKESKTTYYQWFDGVFDSLSLNGVYLSHHGVDTIPSDCQYQIYGHHHNSELPDKEKSWGNSYKLSLEFEDYKPIELQNVIGRIHQGKNGNTKG